MHLLIPNPHSIPPHPSPLGSHQAVFCLWVSSCLWTIHETETGVNKGGLLFSHSAMSDSLWPRGLQHARVPVFYHLPQLGETHDHWVGDAVQPSSSLSSPVLLPSIFPSFKVFSNESVPCIRWSKYWSFSFSISPLNEYDWFELLAVQGTLKSLLQNHSSKAPILWCSAFFVVQLLYPYMTTGKTIALTRLTFVRKLISGF